MSSPRPEGCSTFMNGFIASINVFPTSVGMLLIWGKAALCPTVDAKPVKFPPDPNTQGY